MEDSNAGIGFLGSSGLFSPHWAFPMVFVVVVVVVVVFVVSVLLAILVVEFESGSCPVCISAVLAISG